MLWNVHHKTRSNTEVGLLTMMHVRTHRKIAVLTLIQRTGPKISSFQILLVVGTSMMMVGGTKNPAPLPDMGDDVCIYKKNKR